MVFVNSACIFIVCLAFSASNSWANPVEETQDRRLDDRHYQKCPHSRGQFPHFRYCDWFYNCWDGAVYEQQCPKGLAFNPRCQYCDYPVNVDCGGRAFYAVEDPVDSMCPAPDGVFPDPWDCSYFVQCAGGRGSRQACPAGLLFNPSFYGCDYPQNVKCVGTLTPSTQPSVNPDGGYQCPSGSYPHTSCKNFWTCSGHQLTLESCPAGQHFDASCSQCKNYQLVKCQVAADDGVVYRTEALGEPANQTQSAVLVQESE